MEQCSSKTFLISEDSEKSLRSKRRKKYVFGVVIIFILAVLVTVIGTITYMNHSNHKSGQKLGDILPKSFHMELEGYNRKKNKWIRDDSSKYYFQVDFENNDFRYLKTVTAKQRKKSAAQDDNQIPYDLHVSDSNITIVNDQAIATYLYDREYLTLCHDVHADGLYSIIQLAPTATLKSGDKSGKKREWSISTCEDEIIFSEKNSKILSIEQGSARAKVIVWNTKKQRKKINLPNYDEKCHFKHPQLIDVKNCPEKPRRKPNLLKGSAKKDCLFIHGAGERKEKNGFKVVKSFPSYWGHIESVTSGCKSHSFIRMNTVDYGWDEKLLHEHFCQFAGGINSIIKNKVIFSHSMGNLIVAAALYKKVCTFDSGSSKWYSIQAPWKGSKAADTVNRVCNGTYIKGAAKVFNPLVKKVLTLLNYCSKSGVPSKAYGSLETNYVSRFNISFQNVINIATKFVTGAMCGDSPTGLHKNPVMSVVLYTVQAFVKLDRPNDGVVSFESCRIMGDFKDTFHHAFYKTRANHFEGSCRLGDSKWHLPGMGGNKPCAWIGNREV